MPRHLIIGVSGQDGAYLAQHLLREGEFVIGTSRSAHPARLPNLVRLGIADALPVVHAAPADAAAVARVIADHDIDRLYLLAGQSSVGLSFEKPVETYRGLVDPAIGILDMLRLHAPHVRLLYAGSGEVFSPDDGMPFNEQSRHSPKSPYAVAKSAAMTLVDTYRAVYGTFAATAILFNHESPLRPPTFVIPKLVAAAARIAGGSPERVPVGDIDIARDWGWAADYVIAMRRIIEHGMADNFIVATGETHTIREAIEVIARCFRIDLLGRCDVSQEFFRPCDARVVVACPHKIATTLGWRPIVRFADMISALCAAAKTAHDASSQP